MALPSPSRDEKLVSSYVKNHMEAYGYCCKEDKTGNLLFYKDTSGKKTLFACHMDTVPLAVNAHLVETEEEFRTDGTTALGADDKAAIAVLLDIAQNTNSDFALLCLCAEEIGLYGSRQLEKDFFSPLDIECCYVLDAQQDVGTIVTSAIGKSRLSLKFIGKSAHAGFAPEKGINAIKMAALFCSEVEVGRLAPCTTLNIGSFISEGSTNVVPEEAEVMLEVRSDSDEERFSIIDSLIKRAKTISSEANGDVSILHEDLYSPYSIDTSSQIIQRARKAIEKIGRNYTEKSTTGGSDANNLNKLGIESIVLTSGYYNAHSKSEYIKKKELFALKRLTEEILKNNYRIYL